MANVSTKKYERIFPGPTRMTHHIQVLDERRLQSRGAGRDSKQVICCWNIAQTHSPVLGTREYYGRVPSSGTDSPDPTIASSRKRREDAEKRSHPQNPTGCKPESIIAQSRPRTRTSYIEHALKRERFGENVCDSGNGLELTHCSQELRGWFGVGPFGDRVAVAVYRCRSRAMYSLGNRAGALKFRQEVWRGGRKEIENPKKTTCLSVYQ